MISRGKSAAFEWVVLLVPSIAAVAFAEVIGLSQSWEDGVVYTVVLFATIVSVQRAAWGRKSFWTSLALLFAVHTIVLTALLQMLPPRRFGLPKLLLIPACGVEGVLILALVRGRMKALGDSWARS